ncbi:MAG: ribonuclease HI [Blastocatellia bacterium]
MAQKKYYAVRNGREPGIYRTWDECKAQVEGYPNAAYKGFASLGDAEVFLGNIKSETPVPAALFADPKPTSKSRSKPKPKAEVKAPDSPATDLLETTDGLKRMVIYTDGACTGNPGPGGYGAVLMHGGHRKELSGGFRLTTNNRMEISACIVALQSLNGRCHVTLHSDSKYVVNTMSKGWARRWRLAGWKRKEGYGENEVWKDALNADLWEQMLDICDQHKVTFVWVRGHAGNEENERCDQLAREAILDGDLAIDLVYEEKWRK